MVDSKNIKIHCTVHTIHKLFSCGLIREVPKLERQIIQRQVKNEMVARKKNDTSADLKVRKDSLFVHKQQAPSIFEVTPLTALDDMDE